MTDIPHTELPDWVSCPHCGYKSDHATPAAGKTDKPEPGALNICLNCGDLSKFLFNMQLGRLSPEEEDAIYLDDDRRKVKIVKVAQAYIKQRGRIK